MGASFTSRRSTVTTPRLQTLSLTYHDLATWHAPALEIMADTVSEDSQGKTPVDISKLTFETVPNRRRIIAAYWLVVILALPLWWKTTSIDRLSLPESKLRGLSGKEVHTLSVFSKSVSYHRREIAALPCGPQCGEPRWAVQSCPKRSATTFHIYHS